MSRRVQIFIVDYKRLMFYTFHNKQYMRMRKPNSVQIVLHFVCWCVGSHWKPGGWKSRVSIQSRT